jgi:hypothetical protein
MYGHLERTGEVVVVYPQLFLENSFWGKYSTFRKFAEFLWLGKNSNPIHHEYTSDPLPFL